MGNLEIEKKKELIIGKDEINSKIKNHRFGQWAGFFKRPIKIDKHLASLITIRKDTNNIRNAMRK